MNKEIYCRVWTKKGYRDLTQDEWIRFDYNNLYRIDGPVFEGTDGTKTWFINGKPHRFDGPAIEYLTGGKVWFINGNVLNREMIETWIEENNIDLSKIEDQMAFKLRWS